MSEPSSTAPTSQRCAKQCSPDADPQLLQFRRVQFSAGFPDLIVNAAYVLQVLNAYGKVYPTPPPSRRPSELSRHAWLLSGLLVRVTIPV